MYNGLKINERQIINKFYLASITDFLDKFAHLIPGVNKLSKELRLVMASFILISIPFGLAFALLV